jgi:hypothetical protein
MLVPFSDASLPPGHSSFVTFDRFDAPDAPAAICPVVSFALAFTLPVVFPSFLI